MAADAATSGTSLVEVGKSALYVSGNDEYLARTPGATGVEEKGTFSGWLYRGTQGFYYVFTARVSDSQLFQIYLSSTGILHCGHYSSGYDWNLTTTQVFRDIGWYHIVLGVDTTRATAGQRAILYVNGKRVTEFSTETYPSLNFVNDFNTSGVPNHLGSYNPTPANEYDGYMAEVVWIDGTQYAASDFGEFDSTGLYWTPKSSAEIKALTFGTNGFYLDNTTNAQTDASGEGNNFTNNNTVTTTTHTPTNSSALFNPLYAFHSTVVLSNGNRTIADGGATNEMVITTLAIPPNSGKWYFDLTWNIGSTAYDTGYLGLALETLIQNPGIDNPSTDSGQWSIAMFDPYFITRDGTYVNTTTALVHADTTMVAYDSDTGKLFFGVYDTSAGTNLWFDGTTTGTSGDPAAGSNPTVTLSATERAITLYPFAGIGNSDSQKFTVNFEDDDFARTPPTGFKALNTTNIASATTRTASDTTKYFDTILYEGNGAGQRVGQFQPFDNAFTVAKSALFDDGDTELTRTPGGDGNLDTWTFSTWIKFCDNDGYGPIFGAGDSSSNQMSIYKLAAGNLRFQLYAGASWAARLITTQKWLESSTWINVVCVWDSGNSTLGDRMRMYVDGVRIIWFDTESYPSSGLDGFVNDASYLHWMGNDTDALAGASDTYVAQSVLLDGTAVANADNFGQTDTSTNKWIPKEITGLTMGTNGFFMDYAASGSDLGDDAAGSIDYANNGGIQTTDSPTLNWCTLDSSKMGSGLVPSNGNRTLDSKAGSGWAVIYGTIPMTSGKWYWECHVTSSASDGVMYGVTNPYTLTTHSASAGDNYYNYSGYGTIYGPTAYKIGSWTNTTFVSGDKISVAVDMDNGFIYFAKNDTWLMSSDPTTATGTGAAFSIGHESILWPIVNQYLSYGTNMQFDSSLWSYSAPTGYSALNQDALTSSDQFITALAWIKNRDAADSHMWLDRVRGIKPNAYDISCDLTTGQIGRVESVQRMLAGGVELGNFTSVNTANESYVLWDFMMEATGSGSSNTDGSINTTKTLVDTTLGLSISTYDGTGANATAGHGLGVAPEFVIVKKISASGSPWAVYHVGNDATAPQNKGIYLNTTGAGWDDNSYWNDTAPTSSVFTISTTTNVNGSGVTYVAYCFAPSQFISIGSYTGNGNADGAFVPILNSLGVPIQPSFFMMKAFSRTSPWTIYDTSRLPYNVNTEALEANASTAEQTHGAAILDFDTGGMKMRGTSYYLNQNAATYIYLAIGTPMIDTDGRIIAGK